MDLSLERVQQVRDAMGLRFNVPVITVAGTNGKGSTCSMIESIARAAGYRVGLYIKPHLVHFEERCRVNGAPVSADSLGEDFAAVDRARGDTALTTFEFSTLAIMHRLARELELGARRATRLRVLGLADADDAGAVCERPRRHHGRASLATSTARSVVATARRSMAGTLSTGACTAHSIRA